MATINVPLLHSHPSFGPTIVPSHPSRWRGLIARSRRESEYSKTKFGAALEHNNKPQLSGFKTQVRDNLWKLDFGRTEDEEGLKIPEAKGSLRFIRTGCFINFLHTLYFKHGSIFKLVVGPKSFIIVSDPSIAKHILKDNAKNYSKGILAEILQFVMGKGLISADGEIWRVRRRAIVPALHFKYVAAMINLFGQATERLLEKLKIAARDEENVEMESMFSHMTLDVIGKAVFNYDFDSLRSDTGVVEAVYTLLREAEMRGIEPIPLWNIPIWKYISPRQKKVSKALKLVNETLDHLISICKRMVEEENDHFNEDYVNDKDPSILRFLLASGNDVSSNQLRDDLMTLLIAGHETTSAALTWTFYLLSQNPSVMSKLQEEIDTILGDRVPTIEDMKKLKYASCVIKEALRLYPQPPTLVRRAIEDDMLGQYPIKKGDDIFISLWNIHRSPTHWENPEEFIPERWDIDGPNQNESNKNFSYMPFGGGPRKCVGDQFATFEAVVALSMLVRRFDFKMASNAPEVNITTGATIHTTEGLMMTVTERFTHQSR